jgi:hypothetical protein
MHPLDENNRVQDQDGGEIMSPEDMAVKMHGIQMQRRFNEVAGRRLLGGPLRRLHGGYCIKRNVKYTFQTTLAVLWHALILDIAHVQVFFNDSYQCQERRLC